LSAEDDFRTDRLHSRALIAATEPVPGPSASGDAHSALDYLLLGSG